MLVGYQAEVVKYGRSVTASDFDGPVSDFVANAGGGRPGQRLRPASERGGNVRNQAHVTSPFIHFPQAEGKPSIQQQSNAL